MHAEFQSRDAGLVIPVPPLTMAADCQAWLENLSGHTGTGAYCKPQAKNQGHADADLSAIGTRPRQSVPNSGFHLVGPGLILGNLV